MSDSRTAEEPDLRTYLQPLLRRWWLIAIVVVAGTAFAYWSENRKPEIYQASTSLFVAQSEAESVLAAANTLVIPSDRGVANQAALLRSRAVAAIVQKQLKTAESPDSLRSRIVVEPESNTDILTITATGGTGKAAADLANAYAEAFVATRARDTRDQLFDARRDTGDELTAIQGGDEQAQIKRFELRTRIRQLKAVSKTATGGAEQLDAALAPGAPIAPEPRKTAIFGFGLSLLFGYLLVLGLDRLDRRFRKPDELADAYELPLLSVIPHAEDPCPRSEAGLLFAPEVREPLRSLRVNVQLQSLDRPPKLLLVTSALPSEGKSTVARNLALAYAESGARVTIVEADLRKPSLSGYFGVEAPGRGLTDVLLGESSAAEATLALPVAEGLGGTLSFMPAGAPAGNPPAVLGSERMRTLLTELATTSDVVIVDSPPLLAVSDTLTLLRVVDSFILVSRVGLTTRDAVRRVKDVLSRISGATPLGLVADDVTAGSAGYGYGYGEAYGSAPSTAEEPTPAGTAASS